MKRVCKPMSSLGLHIINHSFREVGLQARSRQLLDGVTYCLAWHFLQQFYSLPRLLIELALDKLELDYYCYESISGNFNNCAVTVV